MNSMLIRDLAGMGEFLAAEALQRAVWGEGDTEDPADLMMVIQNEGGLVAGAFDAEGLAGYVFGFPTRDPAVQHSHRLAVHPRARGRGLALRLKRYQREWCLARGIALVRWTFDPLRHTNAHLNIGRLGAVASTYLMDYYGEMQGINAGLPSDRLLAEWHLGGEWATVLAEETGDGRPAAFPSDGLRVPIPLDLDHLLATDYPAAFAERMRVRESLVRAFAEGCSIRFYDPADLCYVLIQGGPAR